MKNYNFKINGNRYEVEVLEVEGNLAKIEVNGTLYNVEMEMDIPKVRTAPAVVRQQQIKEVKPAAAVKPTGQTIEVRAPLPGVIIQVLAKPGDVVKSGQTLCTLETMKMENAIKADRDGMVSAVNVSPGQTVIQDEVLIAMNI